ncbi:hypothetical protein BH11PSE4_BH11PSE4_37700 [soil metagenome]
MTIFQVNEKAPKILIADDDPSVVRLLAARCELMGFAVETACNGTELLHKVAQGGFDTMVVDIHMPGIDGLSVCACVMEASARPLHVIVATGSRDPAIIARCDALGALYLRKGEHFWESLETALVEIYPAQRRQLKESGLRSVRAAMPARSRVLLVDEDVEIESVLRCKLGYCGIDTLYATDAAQGFRVACREEPSAIVADYQLPKGSIRELMAQLRAEPSTRKIPLIVLGAADMSTAEQQELLRSLGDSPGAMRVLSKSTVSNELFAALQQFCGLHQAA